MFFGTCIGLEISLDSIACLHDDDISSSVPFSWGSE